jgi:hypothetical protein
MRRVMACCLVAVAGLFAAPAVALASPPSGLEHFVLTRVDNQPGAILARGAFWASGVEYGRANTDLAVFAHGAFSIHHPNGSVTVRLNPVTCLVTVSFSGTYQINNGYGRFKGIQGFGLYHGNSVGVAPRNATGTCSHRPPLSTTTRILAEGPVTF